MGEGEGWSEMYSYMCVCVCGCMHACPSMHLCACAFGCACVCKHIILMRGVMVSMSAFLACHQCYCAGSSLAWGLNLRAVVCGIF